MTAPAPQWLDWTDADVLARLVGDSAEPVAGWRFDGAQFVVGDCLQIRLVKADVPFRVWIRASGSPGGSFRQTQHFLLGYQGEPPDPTALAAIDAIVSRVEGRETDVPAALLSVLGPPPPFRPRPLFPIEWIAVKAGLKSAARTIARRSDIDAVQSAAAEDGLVAVCITAPEYLRSFSTGKAGSGDTLVYLAADRGHLDAAVKAEAVLIEIAAAEQGGFVARLVRRLGAGDQARKALDAKRALGAALGYPPCCVEFFLARPGASNHALRAEALARTVGAPDWRLNNADFGNTLISHFVCSYGCEPSADYASAVLTEWSRVAPVQAHKLARQLKATVGGLGSAAD